MQATVYRRSGPDCQETETDCPGTEVDCLGSRRAGRHAHLVAALSKEHLRCRVIRQSLPILAQLPERVGSEREHVRVHACRNRTRRASVCESRFRERRTKSEVVETWDEEAMRRERRRGLRRGSFELGLGRRGEKE
eukprot:3279947-Rhodomonas_salina.2